MSRRALAILSEGMLSESQKRSLTLLSLGMIEVTLSPTPTPERRRRGGGRDGSYVEDQSHRIKLQKEDEEILALIRSFIEWEA
ncbi:MAG: hypothetical protein WC055_02290 [Melioribacteraceae bacterium]